MEVGYHSFHHQNSHENSHDSPLFYDTKATSTTSPKKSRRGIQKRVVHVPMKEVEGSRLKGETNTPPADSWAWRKYGQKPIKGSPYPRGYYRCSSSKGCPAKKQVERSRTEPTTVMVTYSCEHNHPWPASRNNNRHHHNSSPATSTNDDLLEEEEEEETPSITGRQSEPEPPPVHEPDQRFTSLEVGPFSTATDQYGWFADVESTMFESPLMARDMVEDSDMMASIFSTREDEESFFADLGELPECTTVFRRREIERVEEHHQRVTITQ